MEMMPFRDGGGGGGGMVNSALALDKRSAHPPSPDCDIHVLSPGEKQTNIIIKILRSEDLD